MWVLWFQGSIPLESVRVQLRRLLGISLIKTLKELQLNKFPCRVCKVIRLPHREGCPYYEEPPEKKIPVEKMVPNDSASSQYNCSACGGNHVMEECLIRNAILKQGFL